MISIVIPAYNEGKTLQHNIYEIINYVKQYDFEIVLVDDGSKDNTWDIITLLSKEYNNIRGLKFSRNFGKEAALLAGVTEARGEAVITMDSDLQHPPKYISEMISKWNEGYKVVECVRSKRPKESFIYKICAGVFYKTLQKLTGVDMANGGDFKLMDRQVVNEVIKLKDTGLFFRGMVNFVGFKKAQIGFEPAQRKGDTTKFNFKSLTKLALNAITSFSVLPLNIPVKLGVVTAILGLFLFVVSFFAKSVPVFANAYLLLAALELFITTMILFCLGIIGLYIGKIYEQTKERPRYIIEEKCGN